MQTRPGRQIDDFPYSTILDRQNDFYYKGFADWCAARDGALPRRDGSTSEERSLASWFRHKLRLYYSDDLSDEELVKLKKIPAINAHFCLHGQRSLKFALKSMNFADWCATRSRVWLGEETGEETSSGIPSYSHHGKHSENKRPNLRKSLVPVGLEVFSAKSRLRRQSEYFALKCKSFEDWCAQHGGSWPKQNGDTQEERSLAIWFKDKLFRYRRGKLSLDQLAQLKKNPAISEVFSLQGKSFRSSEHFALKCKNFEDWCAQHGQTLPKQVGDTQEETTLGTWLMNKLFRYRRGKLSDDQLAQLRKIPAICDLFSTKERSPSLSERFDSKCKSLEDWCASHKTLPKGKGDTQEERSLAIWLRNKLFRYRRGRLSFDQQAKLREIPVISEVLNYKGFADWCATHDGTLPRIQGPTADERSLASWFKQKLDLYLSGELSDEEVVKLKKITAISLFFILPGRARALSFARPGTLPQKQLSGERKTLWGQMISGLKVDHLSRFERFHLKCNNLEEWCAAHNGTLPKENAESQQEKSLAIWLKDKLRRYRLGKLRDEQVAKLQQIPVIIEQFGVRSLSRPERFHLRCQSLKDWCAAHNTLPRGTTKEERSLAIWLQRKLYSYRNGKLPDDQLAALRKIPVVDAVLSFQGRSLSDSEPFDLKCKSFDHWCAAHNGTLPRWRGTTKEERSLAIWFQDKLFRYRRGKLCDDQLAQLRKIPAISAVFSVQGKSFRSN